MFYFYNDLFFQTVNPVDWTWAVIAGNFIIKLSSWLEDILFRCIFNFSGSGPENIVQENIILYDFLLQGEFSFIIVTIIYIYLFWTKFYVWHADLFFWYLGVCWYYLKFISHFYLSNLKNDIIFFIQLDVKSYSPFAIESQSCQIHCS